MLRLSLHMMWALWPGCLACLCGASRLLQASPCQSASRHGSNLADRAGASASLSITAEAHWRNAHVYVADGSVVVPAEVVQVLGDHLHVLAALGHDSLQAAKADSAPGEPASSPAAQTSPAAQELQAPSSSSLAPSTPPAAPVTDATSVGENSAKGASPPSAAHPQGAAKPADFQHPSPEAHAAETAPPRLPEASSAEPASPTTAQPQKPPMVMDSQEPSPADASPAGPASSPEASLPPTAEQAATKLLQPSNVHPAAGQPALPQHHAPASHQHASDEHTSSPAALPNQSQAPAPGTASQRNGSPAEDEDLETALHSLPQQAGRVPLVVQLSSQRAGAQLKGWLAGTTLHLQEPVQAHFDVTPAFVRCCPALLAFLMC